MLQCKDNEIIYVVCPAEYKTGGTELLHQLVHILNKNGLNAYITYFDIKSDKNPVNDAFTKYVSRYKLLDEIEDNENNIIVLPEIKSNLIGKFKKARTAIWWLSVDNYLKTYSAKYAYKLIGFKGVLWYVKNLHWRYRIEKINKLVKYNLVQSYYAKDFLEKNKFDNIMYLSDYIGDIYLEQQYSLDKNRNNVVLYNPKKGMEFTKKLIEHSPQLKWVPIINMTNEEVVNLLKTSKVYIDFGNHPGKDRFPREAAYCGCCVITGKSGSANYFEDVKIYDSYKYDECDSNIPLIINTINKCFEKYEECQKDFDLYREMIKSEKKQFEEDARNIFL